MTGNTEREKGRGQSRTEGLLRARLVLGWPSPPPANFRMPLQFTERVQQLPCLRALLLLSFLEGETEAQRRRLRIAPADRGGARTEPCSRDPRPQALPQDTALKPCTLAKAARSRKHPALCRRSPTAGGVDTASHGTGSKALGRSYRRHQAHSQTPQRTKRFRGRTCLRWRCWPRLRVSRAARRLRPRPHVRI